jgi:type VI secretion system secreted protein Hcp
VKARLGVAELRKRDASAAFRNFGCIGEDMQLRNGVFVLITLVGALASTAAVADDMFLGFSTEIVGDSTDPQHTGEIVLLSYSLGVTAETSWTKGGGASVGKPNPGDLQFTAALNRSIPTILKYISSGQAVDKATLTVRSDPVGNKAGFEYAKYTFEGVFFTSLGQGLNGVGRAVSAVSFVYKTVKAELFAPGSPAAVSCVFWDIPTGKTSNC